MTAPDNRTAGQIVTFYSYKGGTGRTMALANIAWILAANGYRVLTVDWDLESPGLHRYFHPFLRDKNLRETDGVIEMIRRFSDAAMGDDEDPIEITDFREYTVSLEWDFGTGRLDFLGAGRQGPPYSKIVSTFGWDAFWRARGNEFFPELRRQMLAEYDFVLIDSRTGLSDTAGICTVEMPDMVVACFTLNTQSIEGSAAVAKSIVRAREARGGPVPRILPVPTRVEDGEQRRLERGRAYAHRMFSPLLVQTGIGDLEDYWGSIELPYRSYYAYEEILATFGDLPNLENSLLAPYLRLARRIAGLPVSALAIEESVRQRYLRMFERSDPIEPSRILINYVPLDRVYAEWLREQLLRNGHTPQLHFAGAATPDLDEFDRAITLISRDYETFPENDQLADALQRRGAGIDDDFALSVQTAAVPLPAALRRYPSVDLTRIGNDRALDVVLDALKIQADPSHASLEDSDENIRYPRLQAKHWNLQLVRNASFSGRHRLLEALRDQLAAADPAEGGRIALEGINGVGKTQIALEYAHRFAATYDIVWWISAEQTDRVRTSLAELAERLGIPGNAEERLLAVREMLRQGEPSSRWLIVLDNADSPEELHDFIPAGTGHVIITSRNPHWSEKYHVPRLDVEVFARGESVELLQRRVRGLKADDADRIADALGDLPLALEQAAAWLALTGSTPADYLAELAIRTAQVLDQQAPPNQPSTTASVRLSYERLSMESPAAARLLRLFAFLAPEAIPFRLLESERLSEYLAEIDPTMHDPLLQRTLISVIGRYALARVNTSTGGGAVVHRLTQRIIRDELSAEEQTSTREELWRILAGVRRGPREDRDNWPVYEELRAHLEASGAVEASRDDVRRLFLDLASYLRNRNDFIGAEDLATRVYDRWAELHGKDDTLTLRLQSELGNILREAGRVRRAYEIDLDVVERMTKASGLGEAHAYTLMATTGLAASMRGLGEFTRARELDEKNAPRTRETFGPSHERTIIQQNNLAQSIRLTGDFAAALQGQEEVIASHPRQALASNDYRIVTYQDNIAGLLRATGRQREALEVLEQLFGNQRSRAEDAILTWRIAANLAGVLRSVGESLRGYALVDEAYDRLVTLGGPQYPDTITAELELACAMWWSGRPGEGRKHAQRVHDYFRDRYSSRHPYRFVALANLAMIERANGDLVGARTRAEEAATGLKAVLGPAHPHTLIAQMSVATSRFKGGGFEDAYDLDVEILRRLTERLGERHPTTLAAEVNLALSARERRDGPQARAELPRVQERSVDILGASHPYTLAATEARRIDVDIELRT
ncbi:FxSxx-COOH system tetratricopeptide repeat protein [Actinoplanes sp. NPDC026619]|uniref:FxSxx-COOH system tetratricopeptide repeat protein n=1 Tax=Actinoplanes sp. NPDC026619 TaxID=3155798 RepID=UPI00340A23E3